MTREPTSEHQPPVAPGADANTLHRATAWRAAGLALAGLTLAVSAMAQPTPASKPAKAVDKTAAASKPGARKPGERFRDCESDVCPWLVTIPAGSFMMGSPATEAERRDDEGPLHSVKLASFAAGAYEVTFEQFDACVAAKGCKAEPDDNRWGRGKRPVINVDYDDALQFTAWLSRKTGRRYRLPSESEWEYMARAGTSTPFTYGTKLDPSQTNYAANFTYNASVKGQGRDQTLPVGSLVPNAWGLYDVHGNVLEWVIDCAQDDYKGAPADGKPWTTHCAEPRHMLRGGSWYDNPVYSRSAFRGGLAAGNATAKGFRVVRELE
jgi:formylglycine-generating enzyme required for sulfatase activity